MTSSHKTFVGFGLGPIQAGLFLLEAQASGNFSRFVAAEVDAELVEAVRGNAGRCDVNVARRDRIDRVTLPALEVYNPRVPGERVRLIAAAAVADELATALPSVSAYEAGGETSVAAVLARAFEKRKADAPAVLYAAENHNHAAEILSERLGSLVRSEALVRVQTLNTVVGKMSGVITDADTIRGLDLAPLTPGTPRAVLVERFNHILISRVTLEGLQRGIEVFVEKDDLLPFEEAKLYGHNAIHALIGYLARLRGLATMAEAAAHGDIMATARAAFLDESGAALVKKYEHLRDPLFTADGYRAYADDLIERMVNPHLNDLIARVTRDARRKLGYDDRLFGTMRLALSQGIEPIHMAQGAAAALLCACEGRPQTRADVAAALCEIWGEQADEQADHLIALTWDAMPSS